MYIFKCCFKNHTTSPLRSPIEHPSKSSNCSPTSTATPKKVGSTPDTPTATCPSVEMDDAVKQNEDNVKEPGTEKTKDTRQPQDNGQPRDNGQPEENRHPSVIMNQPSTAMGQPHSEKSLEVDLLTGRGVKYVYCMMNKCITFKIRAKKKDVNYAKKRRKLCKKDVNYAKKDVNYAKKRRKLCKKRRKLCKKDVNYAKKT